MRRAALVLSCLLLAASAAQGADASRQGLWGQGTPVPMHRQEAAIATLHGKLYVISGNLAPEEGATRDIRGNSPRVHEYDPRTDRWRERAPIPHATNHIWAIGLGNRIYTIGGFVEGNRVGSHDVFAYDPATDRWEQRAPLPNPARGSVGLAALAGKIHVIGGRDTDRSFETHQVYDPVHDSWRNAAPLPDGRGRDHIAAIVATGGRIHVVGGRFAASDKMTDLHDVYDPKTDRWSAEAPLPTARSGGPGTLYHGLILVFGGEKLGGPMYTETEAYDPIARRWLTLARMPEGRHASGAVVIGDMVYIPGGGAEPGGTRTADTLLTFKLPAAVRAGAR